MPGSKSYCPGPAEWGVASLNIYIYIYIYISTYNGNFLVEASTHVVEVCAYKLKPYNCGTSNRYMEQMHYECILEVQVFLRKPVEHYFSLHVLIALAMPPTHADKGIWAGIPSGQK